MLSEQGGILWDTGLRPKANISFVSHSHIGAKCNQFSFICDPGAKPALVAG